MSERNSTVMFESAIIRGCDALPVTVEVSAGGSIPGITIVGMADACVVESRSRIRCALRSCGFEIPRTSLTVVLRPADVKKMGSSLELAIAAGVLAASGQIPVGWLDGVVLYGGLGLDGAVLPARGTVAVQDMARERGARVVTSAAAEASGLSGEALGIRCISDLRRGRDCGERLGADRGAAPRSLDMADVRGNVAAKRALSIAAAGGHGVLLLEGAPGVASMLARRTAGIMPSMGDAERSECARIASVHGDPIGPALAGERPYRRVCMSSISGAGLVGGGRPVRPGEVTCAHNGVLHLDGLHECGPALLQSLRRPVSDGRVDIVRVDGVHSLPSRALVVATAPACPCGGYAGEAGGCACANGAVERYRRRLLGRARSVATMAVAVDDCGHLPSASSAELRAEVEAAREFAAERGGDCGSITADAAHIITDRAESLGIDPMVIRGIARTIADMDGIVHIGEGHAIEAAALALPGRP